MELAADLCSTLRSTDWTTEVMMWFVVKMVKFNGNQGTTQESRTTKSQNARMCTPILKYRKEFSPFKMFLLTVVTGIEGPHLER